MAILWNSEVLVEAFEDEFNCAVERHTAGGVVSVAVFSPRRQYRYFLSRIWDNSLPPCVVCMCNPSTADAFKNDPTVARMVGFARAWGCGGLIVVNAFARRATDPQGVIDCYESVGIHNHMVVATTVAEINRVYGQRAVYIAAWGALAERLCRATGRRATATIRDVFKLEGVPVQCLGVSREGHPRHPLYLAKTTTRVNLPLP